MTGERTASVRPMSRRSLVLAVIAALLLAVSLGAFVHQHTVIHRVHTITDTRNEVRLGASGCPDGVVCTVPNIPNTALTAIRQFLPQFRPTFQTAQSKADTLTPYLIEVHGTVGTDVALQFRAQCVPGGGKVATSTIDGADGARITVGGVPGSSVSIVLLPIGPSAVLPTEQAQRIAQSPLSQIARC